MARKIVQYTYRTRLVHLEIDGAPVTGDSGEVVYEDVETTVSAPLRATRSTSPQSAGARRAVAQRAIKLANMGQLVHRDFLVADVEMVSKRVFPAG